MNATGAPYSNTYGTGAITTLNSDGFTVGSNDIANKSEITYHWVAYGNSGCADFKVGAYSGNDEDNRSITGLGFRPDLVTVQGDYSNYAFWRTSAMPGDYSENFLLLTGSDLIQTLEADGFQIGASGNINRASTAYQTYHYFAFKASSDKLKVGSYTGNGTNNRSITGVGFNPTLVWIEKSVADSDGYAVFKDSGLTSSLSHYFQNLADATNLILTLEADGFKLGTSGTVNQSSRTYYYSAWNISAAPTHLNFYVQPVSTTPGTQISPSVVVEVLDQYNNRVYSDNSTPIGLALYTTPGSGTLYGNQTKTAVNGIATFANLSIDRAADGYSLIASSSGLTSAISNTFNITGEGTNPRVISRLPDISSQNISINSPVIVGFNQAMDQPSMTAEAFILKATYDNNGATVEGTPLTGTATWDSDGKIFYYTPSASLINGYTYLVSIDASAKNTGWFPMASTESWSFTAIYSHSSQNTIYSADRKARVVLGTATLPTDGYVKINRDPRNNPTTVDPAKITQAINTAIAEGNPYHYPIQSTITEFTAYDSTNTRVTTTFAESANLALYYEDSDNDGNLDGTSPVVKAKDLLLYRLDETNGLWVRSPNSSVNSTDHFVSAPVKGFSVYVLMSTPAQALSSAYAFPNPYKPSLGHTTITFTNLASQCTIKIYTIAGELVKTITEASGTGQSVWDVKNEAGEPLASGLYIYLIKNNIDTKTGKLVIVR